jgi:metal-sulfur cluster biosynthetic enzyme
VDLTFTATACPHGFIQVDDGPNNARARREHVQVNEVWEVPWTVELMTSEGRSLLRSFGVA